MNPYLHLLDEPEQANVNEHIGEVLSGGAIPWLAPNPVVWNPQWESGPTVRERLVQP